MTNQLLQLILTQAWQIAALAIVVAIVNRTVAKNRPHLAHALWMLVLIKCVTPPIWGHSLGLFSQLQAIWKTEPVVQQEFSSDEPLLMPQSDIDDEIALVPPADDSTQPGLIAMNESEVASTPTVPITLPTTTADSSFVPEARPWKSSWPTILLSLVAIGAVLTLSAMIVRCVLCLRHIRQHRTTEFDESLNEQLQRLAKKLRLRRVPRIIVSDVLFGPAVIGLWRHVIVLPQCLIKAESPVQEQSREASEPGSKGEMSELRSHSPESARFLALPLSTLDPILAHELLHIRRGDLRTGTLQAIVQSLWWFHPAVWLCNRWLSREAERCCDEQVIAELGCSPAQYARSLLSVIESKHQLQPIPVFPGMKPVEITSQRMERIMSLKSNLKKQTPLWCWLAIAVLAVVVLPGAIAKPATNEETIVTQPAEMSEPHPSRQMDTAPVQLSTKEYIVSDLTERLAKEQNLSLKQAKQSLVEMFEGSVSPVHRVAPRVVAAPAIVQQPALPRAVTEKELLLEKSGRIEQLSSYVFKDDHLVVTQSDAGHAELQTHIERVRRLGFLQFQLEARYVMGTAEDINALMASQKLEKPFIAEAGKETVTFLKTSHSGIVSIEQAREIEELARAKADRFSLQRPKVIAFNGQIATIRFGETKPFIVGFKEDGEPTIRTMDEGLTLRVTPTVIDTGLFRLKSVASVESASVLRQVNAPGKVTETPRSFHIPGITTQQIQTTVELRDDQALYLTGLTTAKDEKEQAVLVILEAHATSESGVGENRLKSRHASPGMDLRLDDSFVLPPDAATDENAVVFHVNQKPVSVKDLLAEASTTVLLKPIPGMDELERHRLVANEIQRAISLYAFEEVFLQHFNAELSSWENAELDQAIAERDASLSKEYLPSLADVHDIGSQQQVLNVGLNDCLKANPVAEEVFSRLSRSTRVSKQLEKSPSMDHSTIELVTSRCNQLLIEARLRTVVSLRFDEEDLFSALGSIAKTHSLFIVLEPDMATIHRGQSPPEEFKLTYHCEDKLLSEAIAEIITPLGLRWQLSGTTVRISPDAEADASRDEDANGQFSRTLHDVTTAGTPIEDHIDEPSGVGIASVDSIDEPKVRENEHALDPLVALTRETRNQVVRRLLSTDRHTPWQIMSGIEGLRRDMLLTDGETTVNALEWIQAGPMYQGEPWFEKTEHGGRAHPFSKPYWFEGHVNQFLSKLAACRLPLDANFGTPDGPITIQDMINHAKMVVNDKVEVSWTLLALCRYLPPDARWTNANGEEWSIERLVGIEVGKQVGGPTSPNGGTDGLYALAVARNEYLKIGKPLEGVWLKADEKIKKYIDLAKSQQNPDGTLSSDFFRSRMLKQFDRRLSSTGHLLQFLMHAVSDEQLKEDWIQRAVEATATDIQINRKVYVSCEPRFTATAALTTYLERVTGESVGLVARPLPQHEQLESVTLEIHVSGLVKVPGSYQFPDGKDLYLLDAVSLAGGITSKAETSITVERQMPVSGGSAAVTVLFYSAKRSAAANVRLRPGDIVTVAELSSDSQNNDAEHSVSKAHGIIKYNTSPLLAEVKRRLHSLPKSSTAGEIDDSALRAEFWEEFKARCKAEADLRNHEPIVVQCNFPKEEWIIRYEVTRDSSSPFDALLQMERQVALKALSENESASASSIVSQVQPQQVATGSESPSPKQTENAATIEKSPAPYILVAYPVADQVLPVWSGAKKADFAPIVELIKATVEPESWRDGQAAIAPSNENLFVVIRQTPKAHEQIAKLLSQLNDDLDQVVVRCGLMKLTSEQHLKGIEERCTLNIMNEHQRWALLTKERSEGLAKFLTDEKCQVLLCPTITMFSGTSGAIRIGEQDNGSFKGFNLFVEPRIVVDSPIIRLKHAVDFATKDGTGAVVQVAEMNPIAKDESLISSGQTLLLLIEQNDNPLTEKTPGRGVDSKERFALMLTVRRLEEEPLDK